MGRTTVAVRPQGEANPDTPRHPGEAPRQAHDRAGRQHDLVHQAASGQVTERPRVAQTQRKGREGRCGKLKRELRQPTFRKLETWTPWLDGDLRLLLPAGSLPPDLRVVWTIEHVRQFLFDLAQARGGQLKSGLIERIVPALFCETGVQVAQISDFLAKAGEVFRNVGHLFHHTPYFPNRL